MKILPTAIPDLLLLEPQVFEDERGFFYESFNERRFLELTGLSENLRFVQDNHTRSKRGVLRGLHYQVCKPQGKLVRVISGEVFDVAVDIRKSSPTFGKWVGVTLSADNNLQAWIPAGFAHGFLTLSETADVLYKVTDYWAPKHERCIAWDDPMLGISWPWSDVPRLSQKDRSASALRDAEVFA